MPDRPESRAIAARLIVTGTLRLLSPAHLGNGDAEGITDMPLLQDAVDGTPLLTGATIAGALRAYLQASIAGYGELEQPRTMVSRLFGGTRRDPNGDQSPLIVSDAYGRLPEDYQLHEVRDGVRIRYAERTADEKAKYDLELLPAGTRFDLRCELLLPEDAAEQEQICDLLARALDGLSAAAPDVPAAIMLGARRTRGFGRCVVDHWHVQRYDLRQTEELLAWLALNHPTWGYQSRQPIAVGLDALRHTTVLPVSQSVQLEASFDLGGPILIRSDSSLPLRSSDSSLPLRNGVVSQPDATQLHSYRPAEDADRDSQVPVISGTSLAGVLRSRASRILASIPTVPDQKRRAFLDYVFGSDMQQPKAEPSASRLIVEEAVIQQGQLLVQSRISIDRFTGSALDTALFNEAPVVKGAISLRLRLRQYVQDTPGQCQAAIGLLLLLLKDLWTADLPVGGAASIGHGRLRGKTATVTVSGEQEPKTWTIGAGDDDRALHIAGPDGAQGLEQFVRALYEELHDHEHVTQ